MPPPPPRRPDPRRAYRPPKLELLGDVAEVTRKTGQNLDLNQVMKTGVG